MHEIRLFGELAVTTRGVRLTGGDLGGVQPRGILALLALHGTLDRADLVGLLWDGRPPGDPVSTLERHVAALRGRLDPPIGVQPTGAQRSVITSGTGGYALDAERVRTDVARFDELVSAAAGRTPIRALPPLTAAVHLAGRPLLAGEFHHAWAVQARERYRRRLIEALLDAAEHALAGGEHRTALELAQRVLALQPSVEQARRITAAAHRALGDRPATLRTTRDAVAAHG